MLTEIPKGRYDTPGPCWIPTITTDPNTIANTSKEKLQQSEEGYWFRYVKPVIKCSCGVCIGLRLHHLHADGTVTASFFHARADQLLKDDIGYYFLHNGKKYHTIPGCGWHVFLKLQDWIGEEFPPEA